MSRPASSDVTVRTSCRVCGSRALTLVMDLGDQCIAGIFPRSGDDRSRADRYPLQLVWCDQTARPEGCGLLQLGHSLSGDLLYSSYWYRSGINRTMTANLHEIAGQAADLVGGLAPGDLVVDIGCNDGTLFDGYREAEGVTFLGIDPSDVTRYAVAKGYEVARTYFDRGVLQQRHPGRQARIITSIAMVYDLEEPAAFVADIAACLAPDGVWVAEFSYMPTMLQMNSFDTVCHEHLEYYSLGVVERIIQEGGLQVLRVELNDVNGGSIRVLAGHQEGREPQPTDTTRLQEIRRRERELGLHTRQPYEDFARRSTRVGDQLRSLLVDLKAQGKRVHIYGASTKGNTTLQFAGIDRALVECAADRNPDKWGAQTIGTRIPIVSEDESRDREPDYYLVLPWHFLDEMIERERLFFERGGRFIIPFPEVRIIDGTATTND
ncbi:class I SAM-dependent methyltransferase [soil metagenome]